MHLPALLLLLPTLGQSPQARRPEPDPVAVREANAAAAEDAGFASSASYAHFLQARLAQAAGNSRGVVDALRLALVTDEDNPHLLLQLAEAHARLGEFTQAERQVRRVLERQPRSPAA